MITTIQFPGVHCTIKNLTAKTNNNSDKSPPIVNYPNCRLEISAPSSSHPEQDHQLELTLTDESSSSVVRTFQFNHSLIVIKRNNNKSSNNDNTVEYTLVLPNQFVDIRFMDTIWNHAFFDSKQLMYQFESLCAQHSVKLRVVNYTATGHVLTDKTTSTGEKSSVNTSKNIAQESPSEKKEEAQLTEQTKEQEKQQEGTPVEAEENKEEQTFVVGNNDNNDEVMMNQTQSQETMETTTYSDSNVVANGIDYASTCIATNVLYGASMLGDGFHSGGAYVRENWVSEEARSDVAVPAIVRGTFWAGRVTTGATATVTGAIVGGLVNGASYLVSNAVVPVVTTTVNVVSGVVSGSDSSNVNSDGVEEQSWFDATKEVATATVSGVGCVLNALSESRNKVLTDLADAAHDTMDYSYGPDAAQISKDAILTVNNCVETVNNTAGLKFTALARKVATNSAKRTALTIKERNDNNKKQRTPSSPVIEEEEEYVIIAKATPLE